MSSGAEGVALESDAEGVAVALRRAGLADVDSSSLTRAMYSSDASLYRVVPLVVAHPRDTDELIAAVAVARETGTPLTMRGAGTSIAGNAVGAGIVLDTSRHLNAITHLSQETGSATVEPGVVHSRLQARASAAGLRFGPDPSTHTRCTIGGMVGNNACGPRALGYGRTVDNVVALDVITIAGERIRLRRDGQGTTPPSSLHGPLRAVVDRGLATIRQEFGAFSRQSSGYALDHLLPEAGFDLARFLVGSEGTLAVVTGAEVQLVRDPPCRAVVLLGYASIEDAADDVPDLLPHRPTACEGLGARMVEVVRSSGGSLPELPRGSGWLFVEVAAETPGEARSAAARVAASASTAHTRVVDDASEMAALWRIREDGAGLATRSLSRPGQPGWEDASVPPQRLGAYLRDFSALLADSGLDGVPYGHFGDGCVHIRIDFAVDVAGGRRVFRDFVIDAAKLVNSYGGSLSGEHGDGRTRSALLPYMYSPAALDLFGQVKRIFDPDNLVNPGVLVDPAPVDHDLRGEGQRPVQEGLALLLHRDAGDFSRAVHRCIGVGKCVAADPPPGGVMCPSYQATRREKDSTRGRARVLQEMVNGEFVTGGWRSPEVHEALDLCLACKGCASDCPTGVDMAAYKSEVLHQTYRRRLRPRSHYTLGWLPRWARVASLAPGAANLVLGVPGVAALARFAAGVDRRRPLPSFSPEPFRAWARRRGRSPMDRPRVVLWADTFTDSFASATGSAAYEVLDAAGYDVLVPDAALCCGLTWISTGQLDAARRRLSRTVTALAEYAAAGIPIVGLEPSCTAVLRSDAMELVHDPRAAQVAGAVRTLAELLTTTPGWSPPDLTGVTVVAQPHCHHSAVLGWSIDERLLRDAGATVTRVDGCCGLAGNFGVERGHYEVSVAVAETQLLPAVRAAPADAVVLADGFSCRTQLDDLAGISSLSLAELLARQLRRAAPSAASG